MCVVCECVYVMVFVGVYMCVYVYSVWCLVCVVCVGVYVCDVCGVV